MAAVVNSGDAWVSMRISSPKCSHFVLLCCGGMEGVNRRDFLYARRIFDLAELNEAKPLQRGAGRAIMGVAALRPIRSR